MKLWQDSEPFKNGFETSSQRETQRTQEPLSGAFLRQRLPKDQDLHVKSPSPDIRPINCRINDSLHD